MIEGKVKGHIIIIMEIDMKENGKKVKGMVKGHIIINQTILLLSKYGIMVYLREIYNIIKVDRFE